MKTLLLAACLLVPFLAYSFDPQKVGSGTLRTVPGIGGQSEVAFAFAKGDRITIDAAAEKKLDRMVVLRYPNVELGRRALTKTPQLSFTMPEDGIVIFRFISDRPGVNGIRYSVTRTPASDAVRNYDTRVVWLKPKDGGRGVITPKRAGEVTDEDRVTSIIE